MYTGYELVDPRNNLPFYVGITDDVYKRFKDHLRCNGSNPAKDDRIRELQKEQEMMVMRPLFRAKTYHDALDLELEWMRKYQAQGIQLLNIAGMKDSDDIPRVRRVVDSKSCARVNDYEGVRNLVWYRYQNGRWPKSVSSKMQAEYEFFYFSKPKRIESDNPKRFERHKKSYERGRKWIAEYNAMAIPPFVNV